MIGPVIQGGIILALGVGLLLLLHLRRGVARRAPHEVETVPGAPLVEPELVSDPAWSASLDAHSEQVLPTLEEPPVQPPPLALVPDPEPEPEPAAPERVLVASIAVPAFEAAYDEPMELDAEPAAADTAAPFATFWLDAAAPMSAGLTAGYLPPLTGMWSTPAGETL
jgi:hypothetical protein